MRRAMIVFALLLLVALPAAAQLITGGVSATLSNPVTPAQGGLGGNFSASTGVLYDAAGTFSAIACVSGILQGGAPPSCTTTPALGTPASGVATNLTGTASGLTAGLVTTNANLTGPITSTGNATAVAAQTGTGSVFVMQASPTLTTPVLGVATGTSVSLTAPSIINANAAALPTSITGTLLRIAQADGVNNGILMDSAATGNNIRGRRSGGTFASPSATVAGATLLALDGGGYDTTNLYTTNSQGRVAIRAVSEWTATDNSTDILFQTTPVGSRTMTTVATLQNGLTLGVTNLVLSSGVLGLNKITASGSAPGAAGAKFELVCGTNAGTAKLTMLAGTSATPVTVVDNVGTGVTGC